ncbi:MAG TPA: M20 family metallopeptidase [Methylomirabilota bacterium]|jgi:hippurate hydrolase
MATITHATLLDDARRLLDDTVELRRRLHRHPEIGLTLPRTQQAVLEALGGLPLKIRTGAKTTSVVATLDGARPGPTVLLRADMDALPLQEETGLPFASEVAGAMHACGHDTHVAMLVGAARLLAARRDSLAGRVVFMFQPGEEGYHGARVMLEEGLLDGDRPPAFAFGLHVGARHPAGVIATRPGPLLASGDTLKITVRGQGGHASAPHDCLDPIPIACEMVQAFQTLVTRRVNAFDPAIVTVAKIEAGTTRNIIPETAHLLGTIRTVSEKTRASVLEGVKRVATGVAAAHGAEVDVDLIQGYPVTVNHAEGAARVLRIATDLLGAGHVHEMTTPIMGSEDFSYVLQRVPGAFAFLGTRPDSGPAHPNHSNRMIVNESALPAGIAMHVAVALDVLGGG